VGWLDEIGAAVGEWVGDVGSYIYNPGRGETVIPSGGGNNPAPYEGSTGGGLGGYADIVQNNQVFPLPSIVPTGQGAGGTGMGGNVDQVTQIVNATGMSRGNAIELLSAAAGGNINAQRTLAAIGIEPYASVMAAEGASGGGRSSSGGGSGSSGGGGGGGGSVWTPADQAALDRALLQTRQIGALFDPNYGDGQWVPLPDGTLRMNGTEIVIDPRMQGDYKPVVGAPGYLVDPLSGNVIDTNGNQIRREELQESIRSNRAAEDISWANVGLGSRRLDLDTELGRFDSDLAAELGRGRLNLDTVLGVGGHNLEAAATENEQMLRNILETNGLNLESFLGTGNLNVNATNAETQRLNALTGRTAAAGGLATDLQQLQDARTFGVIDLMANPNDFVEREYATRALLSPPGYSGPAFRDDPRISSIIDELMQTPDVSGLLPTYQAPVFQPVNLPNPTLPRVSAPTPEPRATRTPVNTPVNRTQRDVTGAAYSNTPVAPENQAASTHFRNVGVPERFLAPLGYAYGTDDGATRAREFMVGDPQMDQNWANTNPEIVEINNPGPRTTATVTPLRDMASRAINARPEMVTTGAEFRNMVNNNRGLKTPIGIPEGEIPTYHTMNNPNIPPIPTRPNRPAPRPNPFAEIMSDYQPGQPFNLMQRLRDMWSGAGAANAPWWWNAYISGGGSDAIRAARRAALQSGALPRLPQFAYGTGGSSDFLSGRRSARSGVIPGGTSTSPSVASGTSPDWATRNAGPQDSRGNFLGQLTSYADRDIAALPNIQYAQNVGNRLDYNRLNTGMIRGPFGTMLPDVGGLNYSQLLDIQQDPESWGVLSSIYNAANRNLGGIFNRVRERAPIGNAITSQNVIRTS